MAKGHGDAIASKFSFTWLDAAEDRGDGVECELSSKLVL